jgi:potassium efflux system protein
MRSGDLTDFGANSVDFTVHVWIDDVGHGRQRSSDLHEAVWWALKDAGIKIAFPQLDVHLDRKP